VTAALDRLPEAQRAAIVLQTWQGWSLGDIAVHMGRTTDAVAGLLKRGLRQLREDLEGLDP
jgi:RNA polymerase sigma-70 factor (ECF subfamily)